MKTSFKFVTVVIALILLAAGTYEYVLSQKPALPIFIENAKASASIDFSRENYSGRTNATISVLINCPDGGKFTINEFLFCFVFIGSTTKQMEENISNSYSKHTSNYPCENQNLNYSHMPFYLTVADFCLSFSYKHPERNITWNFDSPGNYSSKKLPTGYYAFFKVIMAGNNFAMTTDQLRSFINVNYPYVYISTSYYENSSILESANRHHTQGTYQILYSLADNFFLNAVNWQKASVRRCL
ncbi:MAG: hypothetical protein M1496_05740 [Candidatus Thermoplasmatota archaeon]|jgi:hypothetical protein|nr:hypothetical protein [Candidatus Thermoplasmatota archaeon]